MAMKKLFLFGIAALFLATGAAHADCCDMAPLVPAGHAFYVAAKRQFGHGFSSVDLGGEKWKDCSGEGECVVRDCKGNWSPDQRRDQECGSKYAVVAVKSTRYLGLDKDKIVLLCSYRTKPVIRF
jgi:hypothetical protein